MACFTLFPKLPHVRIEMTGGAFGWCPFEHIILMTARTHDSCVLPVEREICFAVIERHLLPGGRAMAKLAIGSQLSLMAIVLCMAGETIGGCTFEG